MARGRKGKTWIGTSGLVLPGSKKTFPEEFQTTSRLHYYSTIFNSIEINSSFYKLHKASTYQKWRDEVKQDFTFTIKLWKDITHHKNLEFRFEDIESFVKTLGIPVPYQGCLLIQFPASIKVHNFQKVEELLSIITELLKGQTWKLCVEFRDKSWYTEDTQLMLDRFHTSPVYHDIKASAPPLNVNHSKVIYLRFHGPEAGYRGDYTHEFLDEYSELIPEWNKQNKDVFVYFNNTLGNAFESARYLTEKIRLR